MAKRKRRKYPKLPNGYGSIRYLGANRNNPFGVYPPTQEFDKDGIPVPVQALAYVDNWYYGFSILTAYKAGTFVPGVYPPKPDVGKDEKDMSVLVKKLLADYNQVCNIVSGKETNHPGDNPTFKDVYEQFYDWKYTDKDGNVKKKKYSKSTMYASQAAFKNCSTLHDKVFKDLRHKDLQAVVDACELKYASLEHVINLYHQMYDFADMQGLCEKDYSDKVKINIEDDDEQGIPFDEGDLKILWQHKNDPTVEFILIMCYSGYRIVAYESITVNLEENYFQGGVKTKSSKNRIVPIHPGIQPLVRNRLDRDGRLLVSANKFRADMYAKLQDLGINRHTPHDCRHTFSKLCEHYEVNENDRKRMLGHSFGQDITNKKYGHRDLKDLMNEICKIKICY